MYAGKNRKMLFIAVVPVILLISVAINNILLMHKYYCYNK